VVVATADVTVVCCVTVVVRRITGVGIPVVCFRCRLGSVRYQRCDQYGIHRRVHCRLIVVALLASGFGFLAGARLLLLATCLAVSFPQHESLLFNASVLERIGSLPNGVSVIQLGSLLRFVSVSSLGSLSPGVSVIQLGSLHIECAVDQ
jgi:hypothetical protein